MRKKAFLLILLACLLMMGAAVAEEQAMVLLSTYTRNIGINDDSGKFDQVYSSTGGTLSLAPLGLSTNKATLQSARRYSYVGTENIDPLVGLPVTVTLNEQQQVEKVEALGVSRTCRAGSLTRSGGQWFIDGQPIQVDSKTLAMTNKGNSPRVLSVASNMTYTSNWSGLKRLANMKCDEQITLVDTDEDGAYDWFFSELVYNGLQVNTVTENTISATGYPLGSLYFSGWTTKTLRYESDQPLQMGDYYNVRFTVTSSSLGTYAAWRNGAALYALAHITKADTVTGTLEEVSHKGADDITCVVDGKTYVWSDQLCKSSDGSSGENAGRTQLKGWKGQQVRLVLDECGYVVKAESMAQQPRQKEWSTVVDVQVVAAKDVLTRDSVNQQMKELADAGFKRVYFILCNPGYPMFSSPTSAPYKGSMLLMSDRMLGYNINAAYARACKENGMEAIAIFKPYEGGGTSSVPADQTALSTALSDAAVGGNRGYFDQFISENPQMRLSRKADGAWETEGQITGLEAVFMLDAFETAPSQPNKVQSYQPGKYQEIANRPFRLWISKTNGDYTLYEGPMTVKWAKEKRHIQDANGVTELYRKASNCAVLTVEGLELDADVAYVAIGFESSQGMYTIPSTMVTQLSGEERLTTSVTRFARYPRDVDDTRGTHVWGLARQPESTTNLSGITVDENGRVQANAIKGGTVRSASFTDWGFEFGWYGQGHNGDGWCTTALLGLARGRDQYVPGVLCEAYPEVRQYWLNVVKQAVEDGFDGVDIRLAGHSSMVVDYMNYGYNQPLVEAYQQRYGEDISAGVTTKEQYYRLMALRGEYFTRFLDEAAEYLHQQGKLLGVHLRQAYDEETVSADWNQLCHWTAPKITFDWQHAVDIADEVTIKDYSYGGYDAAYGKAIREYANQQGKKVWTHCYIQQASNLNWIFLSSVMCDETVDGIILYELSASMDDYQSALSQAARLMEGWGKEP